MRGAFERAESLGYTVVLAEDFEEQQSGAIFARLVLEGRIDGLAIASISPDHPLLPLLSERPVPHVFVNRGVAGSGRNVTMEDRRAVELATEHLARLGHARIGHLAGPAGLDPVVRRVAAFREQAARLSLEEAPVEHGDFSERGGVEAGRRLLREHPALTAVYTATVSQALGFLNLAWESGLDVPGDLSVLAHADMPLAAFAVPPLTGVSMPLHELGAAAVEALVAQVRSGTTCDVVVPAPPALAVRASTAPPRRRSTGRLKALP
jgi:LacI family transcriptional regulator